MKNPFSDDDWAVDVFIQGQPKAKGSYSIFNGRAVSSKETKEWQEWLEAKLKQHIPTTGGFSGPIALHLVFYMGYRKVDLMPSGSPKPSACVTHYTKPDLDKLQRTVFDALERVGYVENDSRISKVYAEKIYDLKAGVHIRLKPLDVLKQRSTNEQSPIRQARQG